MKKDKKKGSSKKKDKKSKKEKSKSKSKNSKKPDKVPPAPGPAPPSKKIRIITDGRKAGKAVKGAVAASTKAEEELPGEDVSVRSLICWQR